MDWSRAKTILIITFFCLNLLLFYQLSEARSQQEGTQVDVNMLVNETKKLLESKQIKLTGDIPREAPKLKLINVDFTGSASEKIPVEKPFKYSPKPGRGSLKDVEPKFGIKRWDSYQFDPVESKKEIYVLNQMYGNYPLFDVQMELFETNGQIVAYRQSLVEVQLAGDQKQQNVIPAYTAIRWLAENYLPSGSVIKEIRLGYHGQLLDSQMQSAVPLWPVWRVSLESGESYYIHAFNGAIESVQPNSTVRKPLPQVSQ